MLNVYSLLWVKLVWTILNTKTLENSTSHFLDIIIHIIDSVTWDKLNKLEAIQVWRIK